MGDKFLGKDEKENSMEDRVEIKKKKKTKKDRKDEKRRKKTIVPRGGKRRETRKKKSRKKKTRNYSIFNLKITKIYTAVFRTMADSGRVDVLGLLGFIEFLYFSFLIYH